MRALNPATGGALSFLGQQGANQQNMENAQAQMAFQKEMSNTSYQRAVDGFETGHLGVDKALAGMVACFG